MRFKIATDWQGTLILLHVAFTCRNDLSARIAGAFLSVSLTIATAFFPLFNLLFSFRTSRVCRSGHCSVNGPRIVFALEDAEFRGIADDDCEFYRHMDVACILFIFVHMFFFLLFIINKYSNNVSCFMNHSFIYGYGKASGVNEIWKYPYIIHIFA